MIGRGHRRSRTVASEWCGRLRLERGDSAAPRPSQPPMPFTSTSCVVLSDEQVSTSLGEETVILGMGDGVYYGLDAVGARVWTLLATPQRVSELVSAVTQEFDVGAAECERDVLALLDELAERRLVREVTVEGDAAVS